MQKEFILTTDACTGGISLILSQLDDQGRERPISYGGRGLRSSEVNWTISELEALAIVEGTRHYHQYLAGRPFVIVTDHVSLTYLNSLKAGRDRLQRWAIHLQGYTFTVKYKPGKKLTHADGLSRREYPPSETVIDKEALDVEAFISAIDSDVFDCQLNHKHFEKPHRQLHSINFVYYTTSDNEHADEIQSVDHRQSISVLSVDSEFQSEQRQCPDFADISNFIY